MISLLLMVLAGEQTITGVVKDPAGKPIAGALVAVASPFGDRVEETTTDAAGRFRLVYKPARREDIRVKILAALVPDHGVTMRDLKDSEEQRVELRLAKAAGVRVKVLDADGKPLKEVRVAAQGVRREPHKLSARPPKPIADRLSTTTDANGVAEFKALDIEHLGAVTVEYPAGATFRFHADKPDYRWEAVRLPRTIAVKGRFAGASWPEGEDVPISSSLPEKKPLGIYLETKARLKDDGSFSATALEGGTWAVSLRTQLVWKTNHGSLPATPDAVNVVNLVQTVPFTGVVRTEDGQPIPGARVHVSTERGYGWEVLTDEQGRYSGRVPSGEGRRSITMPEGYYSVAAFHLDIVKLSGTKTVELPPIYGQRNTKLCGVVNDEAGKPAAGVRVVGMCVVEWGGGGSSNTPKSTTAGADGAFELKDVHRGATVTLRAFDAKRGLYSKPVQTNPTAPPAELKLDAGLAAPLSVLAIDDAGRPIPKVEYRIEAQERSVYDSYWLRDLRPELQKGIASTSAAPVSIGAVPKTLKYQLVASAEGFLPGRSAFTPGDKLDGPITVRLRRALEAAGRVVDATDKPIAGALVTPAACYGSDVKATTDGEGRFRLSGLPCATTVLTVHREGFRFGGGVATGGPITITLKRPEEPAPRPMATTFPARHAEIAKKLMDPLATAVFRGDGKYKAWWAQSYAVMDPARLLELIDAPQWSNGDRDVARRHLAAALAATDVDEAIAQAQAITAADAKAEALLGVAKRLPESAKAKRRPLLADALTAARACSEPKRLAINVAKVGEALVLDGDAGGAAVLREAAETAKKLPHEGLSVYAIGTVAESLALVDFAAAMDLTKDLPGHDGKMRGQGGGIDSMAFDRCRGNMASKIAGRQPENAEKALLSMNFSDGRGRYAPRVCWRMAAIDLPRARRIAAMAVEGGDKATCLVGMAAALGPSQAAEALPLLREAFAVLEKERHSLHYSRHLALALLPVVAAAAPNEADEFLWRGLTIANAGFASGQRDGYAMNERAGAVALTALLAEPFAPEVAEGLAASLKADVDALLARIGENQLGSDSEFPALAVLLAFDPEAREELLKRWPAPIGKGPQLRADYARTNVAMFLFATPKRRMERIMDRHLLQWYVDKED